MLFVLVASVMVLLPSAKAAAPPGTYVALGDSYTSGPLIPLYDQPLGCLRSSLLNYPHIVAQQLGLTLRDASCAGADTQDMTGTQGVTPGPNPPQFDRLDATTSLVTLQIGGNDIGFSSIAKDCLSLSTQGHPCQDKFVVGGVDEISGRIQAVGPKVAAVLQGIHTRSPLARVLVIPYITIVPSGSPILCWPQLPVAYEDIPYLHAKQAELNAMLATQAAANSAEYVDVYGPSDGHDSCQLPGLRWVEPVVPLNLAAPAHPNAIGMLAMAGIIEQALTAP
ncbi:MAG: SGNH/GDSL hydrolase family protein [Acidimicrobiales bacterium]